MKIRHKSLGLLGLGSIAIGLSLSACGDKTAQDQQNEFAQEQLGKFQPVAGNYTGTLTSNVDQKILGTIQISLIPGMEAETSTTNNGTSQRAVLKGSVTYTSPGNTPLTLPFAEGDYNPDTKQMESNFAITDQGSHSHSIEITGTINGNQFNGSLNADEFDKYGATFSVTKNGPNPTFPTGTRFSRRQLNSQNTSGVYTGTVTANGGNIPVRMTLNSSVTDSNQVFLNILSPKRLTSASLDFGYFVIVFPSSTTFIDDQQGILQGTSSPPATQGSVTGNQENIYCTRNTTNGFICTLTGARSSAPFTLNPVGSSS